MELELKKERLETYETSETLVLTQEETTESIVPDYCPDIARIISAEGSTCLQSRDLRDGKAEITGTVRVTVLYLPEAESGIRTLEFAMPFVVESDIHAFPDCSALTADIGMESLETRMLNPRKIFTHCKLICRITAYRSVALDICGDVEAPPQSGVEKRQEQQSTILLTQICEKDFSFTDILHLSPGRTGAAEILHGCVYPSVTETKLIGNKLIFKGLFAVSVLYRTTEGFCSSFSSELPFSQIMEITSAGEDTTASVNLQITGSDYQIDGEDPEGRQFAVTFYCHAAATLREGKTLTLLTDLYSTRYETAYEAQPVTLTAFHQELSRRVMAREILEIGTMAESVLSVSAHCGPVSFSREGDYVLLRTAALVRALYLDESSTPMAVERTVEVSCQMELPPDCRLMMKAVCPEFPQATLGDRGIEVRFPVDFQVESVSAVKKPCMTAVRLEEDAPHQTAGKPSLVLRRLNPRESLWELAKGNHTTISAILSANLLENGEDVSPEKLLLIPCKHT